MSKERARAPGRARARGRDPAPPPGPREAERRAALGRAARALTGWLPRRAVGTTGAAGRGAGAAELTVTVCLLLAAQRAGLGGRPEWGLRIARGMVSLLVAPVLHTLLFRRR